MATNKQRFKKGLKDIYKKAIKKIPEDPRIKLEYEKNTMRLSLSLFGGFEAYEDLTLRQRDNKNLYEITYRAFKDAGLETFSDFSNITSLINDSKTLDKFLQKIIGVDRSPKSYNWLLILQSEGNYKEAKITTNFFCKAFTKKLEP